LLRAGNVSLLVPDGEEAPTQERNSTGATYPTLIEFTTASFDMTVTLPELLS
jgi:hypothetical protein